MKRVIDGKTYNTDTSTVVGRYEYKNQNENDVEATVYLNKGGAFFILHQWQVEFEETVRSKHYMEAVTRAELEALVTDMDNFEIVDDEALQSPPEAGAEPEPGATIYVRVRPRSRSALTTPQRDQACPQIPGRFAASKTV